METETLTDNYIRKIRISNRILETYKKELKNPRRIKDTGVSIETLCKLIKDEERIINFYKNKLNKN